VISLDEIAPGLDPEDYWYVIQEATRAIGDPLAEPISKGATERILSAFAAEGVDVVAAVAEVSRLHAQAASFEEPW
jgi:hypothetical protein